MFMHAFIVGSEADVPVARFWYPKVVAMSRANPVQDTVKDHMWSLESFSDYIEHKRCRDFTGSRPIGRYVVGPPENVSVVSMVIRIYGPLTGTNRKHDRVFTARVEPIDWILIGVV